ncbi:MAG TPA: DUF6677 family protein [Thermoanaerobaculia bacterium]|nr:DUF6677 family protein [Thermoanaerobaculia bacterium]
MAETDSTEAHQPATQVALPAPQLLLAGTLAWLVPGLGHIYLKRHFRGVAFFLLVLISVAVGCRLEGNLYRPDRKAPLTYLATAGALGMGTPYFILRYGLHYEGRLEAAGFEYGTAFLLTGGLMNLLLILDTWDIGSGKKE